MWEKIYEKMQEVGRSTHGVKASIASWAKRKVLPNSRATTLPADLSLDIGMPPRNQRSAGPSYFAFEELLIEID